MEQKLGERLRGERLAAHSPFKVFRRVKVISYTQVAPPMGSGLARNAARFHPSKPCCALFSVLANNLANRSAEKVREAQKNKGIPA